MRFHLLADAVFEADDIDDAFTQLAEHFQDLAENGTEADRLFISGGCEIAKEGEHTA